MPINPLLAVAGGWIGANAALNQYALAQVNNENAKVTPPIGKVSIIAPAWHEEDSTLVQSLTSLKQQNIMDQYPDQFELLVIGCQNVNMELAAVFADKTYCAPAGKLNAREKGHVESAGKIIVSVDVDTRYPPNWLNMVLEPFNEPNVVAVETTSAQAASPIINNLIKLPQIWVDQVKMLGRGSAYLRSAYDQIGGFDTSINQQDINALLMEEEYHFYQRLKQVGKVVFIDAPHIHLVGYGAGRGLHA